jgi:hypothetical protein
MRRYIPMVRGRTLIIAAVLVGTVSAAAVAEEAEGRSAGADWERYGYGSISLLAGITSPTPTTSLYGKAGIVGVVPTDDVAEDYDVGFGALGAFGFEFFFSEQRTGSYFIELGGVGTGAEADALGGEPIYANGFLANVGVRYYL